MTVTQPNRVSHAMSSVVLDINGQARQLEIDNRVSLLDVLRERLNLTGSKKGCDHGQCGACTVLIDGERAVSCLILGVASEERRIVTVEGLADAGDLHPMQEAFLDHDAFQCGYCTSGQICSAIGAIAEADRGWPSNVTEDLSATVIELDENEIRERMSGNLCRCGAYVNIVAAVQDVAR